MQSHVQVVKSLYKRALRTLEAHVPVRWAFRYQATLLRHRFDQNRKIEDTCLIRNLVQKAEEEIFKFQHPLPTKFCYSPNGSAYKREVDPPDWVLDYWHPLEKAQYPWYFAKREKRKIEFAKFWEQTCLENAKKTEKYLEAFK